MYLCVNVYVYNIYIYIYMYIHVCIYIYIHLYLFTYIYIYIYLSLSNKYVHVGRCVYSCAVLGTRHYGLGPFSMSFPSSWICGGLNEQSSVLRYARLYSNAGWEKSVLNFDN